MRISLSFLTALFIIPQILGLFSNSLKKLRQKAKNAYNKKFGKDKTWHFLGFDLTEYPGTNEKYRLINKEKWDDYFSCLLTETTNLGMDFTITPEAIEVFESTLIKLECKLCLSPQESSKADSVEWFKAGIGKKKLTPVLFEENVLVSPTDRSLQIYNIQKEHSGQYVCRIGKSEAAPYFLTVVESDEKAFQEVHPVEIPITPQPQGPEFPDGYKFMIDTEWGEWSACSKCNQIGRRHKLGYCIIKYNEKDRKSKRSNSTEEPPVSISDDDYEILKVFRFGIPCKSHILPWSFKSLDIVKKRKNEIMSGFCKTKCPEDEVFEVKDKNGNVIERANNSAGIYSILQGIPSAQPSVERMLQYATKGKEAVLSCPGNLNSDIPVQWQIKAKKIIPELLTAESKGRMYVSITDKIHIKDVKISDSNIYSCWQHEDLAGTIRLVVETKIELDFNHHIMLFGAVLIFSVILFVLAKAFFHRKNTKNATYLIVLFRRN